MINNEDLDLVILYDTKRATCGANRIMCKKKINIITEKPMATNWNDALSMVKACDDENETICRKTKQV